MKINILAFVLLAVTACSSVPKIIGGGSGFSLRPYKEVTLNNGMKVLLIEEKSLPSISLMMLVKSGSTHDPKGKSGLASMVADLLDAGTSKRGNLELADSLGQIGSGFSASASSEFTMLSASALSFNQESLLTDFAEIITEPAFSEKEVSRVRRETVASLQKLVDEPDDFAGVMFQSYLFGQHPYARSTAGQAREVKSIARKDIIKYYLQNYRPNNVIMAVVGKYDANIVQRLNEKFAKWTQRKVEGNPYPAAPQISGIDLKIIDKADLKQSQIRIGHIGIKRSDPDFLTLRVANNILGGTFSSRLMSEVREKRGLTYSIGSYFDARQAEGPFVVSTFTRHDKVGETLKETLRILKEFQEKGVTEEEVAQTKAYLKGVFPQSLETPEALAQSLLTLRFYGIPDDYLKNYLRNIDRISVADVNAVVKRHLQPEKLKILVFSPRKAVFSQMQDIGPVQVNSYRDFL